MSNITLRDVVFTRMLERTASSIKPERNIINNVSLSITTGERVGLLGANGAGKTTLLRLIAGIFVPDSGSIECGADVSALLDTGHGMVDSLSVRENSISRFIIGGVAKDELPSLLNWVEEFTELHEYFDQPMRSLSSGMFARVVFALATARPHDVVVIDEGFGLADEYFRRKAQVVLEKLYTDASILIFASHNAELLRSTCSRGIILQQGAVIFDGAIDAAIELSHSL